MGLLKQGVITGKSFHMPVLIALEEHKSSVFFAKAFQLTNYSKKIIFTYHDTIITEMKPLGRMVKPYI